MKLEMLLHDAREEGQKEERDRSNTRLSLLIRKLLADGKTQEIEEIAKDERRIDELLKQYGIA